MTSPERWVADVEIALRRAGHSRSSGRPAVIRALADAQTPLSAPELEQVIRATRRVGRATVYHALELLCRHGLAHRLTISDGPARYLAAGRDAHFLLCNRCGALIALTLPALEQTIVRAAARHGVAVDPQPLVLHGVCVECRASVPTAPVRARDSRQSVRLAATGVAGQF